MDWIAISDNELLRAEPCGDHFHPEVQVMVPYELRERFGFMMKGESDLRYTDRKECLLDAWLWILKIRYAVFSSTYNPSLN